MIFSRAHQPLSYIYFGQRHEIYEMEYQIEGGVEKRERRGSPRWDTKSEEGRERLKIASGFVKVNLSFGLI